MQDIYKLDSWHISEDINLLGMKGIKIKKKKISNVISDLDLQKANSNVSTNS